MKKLLVLAFLFTLTYSGLEAQILIASGSGGAYVISNYPGNFQGYYDGFSVIFRSNHNSPAGGATLNINGVGAKAIVNTANGAIVAGDIRTDQVLTVVYNNANSNFQMITASGNGSGGGVSGSGAASFLSKWNTVNTLTTSIIYDNGTNVGIGTSSPLRKLAIQGDNAFEIFDVSAIRRFTIDVTSSDAKLLTSNGAALVLGTGGAEKARIDGAGNVGIGTATPVYNLHVYGSSIPGIAVDVTGAANSGAIFDFVTKGNGATKVNDPSSKGWNFMAYSDAYSTTALQNDLRLRFYNGTAAKDILYFDIAGNVGVGVTAPTNKLEVLSSITTQRYAGQFHNDATSGPGSLLGAVFGYADGVNGVGISKYGAIFQAAEGAGTNYGIKAESFNGTGTNIGGYFNAVAGANNYAAIFDNGNVGIGTTTPTAKLHLNNGHVKSTQTTAPSVVTVLGGGLSHSLSAGSTDIKGTVSMAGAILVSSVSTFRITFNTPYNLIPVVVATVGGSDAGITQMGISIDGISLTDFTISIRNNSGAAINNPRINYIVIE